MINREAGLLAQVVVHDAPGERRRNARGIEIRIDRMARHQAIDPVRDRGVERRQMGRLHVGPRRVDRGQLQVGVERRVALPGEVFGARRDAALLHALDPRQTVAGDETRILAVRADPDVRAVAVGEDIEHGTEVQVHPEPAQLAGLEDALAIRERLFPSRPHREVVGKDRRPLAEHHDAAALVIGGDEQTALERRLEILEEPHVLLRRLEVAPIQDEPGGARLAEELDVGVRELRSRETKHQTLADEAFEVGHRTIIGWHPLAARDLRCTLTVTPLTPTRPAEHESEKKSSVNPGVSSAPGLAWGLQILTVGGVCEEST